MGSGSSPLANRLVDVVEPHVWAVLDAHRPEDVDSLAGVVVAAVLRELASAGALLEDHGSDMTEVCRALADEIEKGE